MQKRKVNEIVLGQEDISDLIKLIVEKNDSSYKYGDKEKFTIEHVVEGRPVPDFPSRVYVDRIVIRVVESED